MTISMEGWRNTISISLFTILSRGCVIRKPGVAGATNFVKVDKTLPPDFTQENFAVGWYTSTGTFVGDLPSYKQRVEEFSNALAKLIPDYTQGVGRSD